MAPIILGSVIGLAIVLEKLWMLRRLKMDTAGFADEVYKNLKEDKVQRALVLCEQNIDYPVAAVLKVGIERRNTPADRLEKILEQAGNTQIQRLEKRLGGLASIIGIEPLLGFLGTITGLIKAFMSWEQAGANVTVNLLAMGIYEAMISTAAGLTVAIPLYLCYNYFVSRTKYIGNELTDYCIQLIEVFQESKEAKK